MSKRWYMPPLALNDIRDGPAHDIFKGGLIEKVVPDGGHAVRHAHIHFADVEFVVEQKGTGGGLALDVDEKIHILRTHHRIEMKIPRGAGRIVASRHEPPVRGPFHGPENGQTQFRHLVRGEKHVIPSPLRRLFSAVVVAPLPAAGDPGIFEGRRIVSPCLAEPGNVVPVDHFQISAPRPLRRRTVVLAPCRVPVGGEELSVRTADKVDAADDLPLRRAFQIFHHCRHGFDAGLAEGVAVIRRTGEKLLVGMGLVLSERLLSVVEGFSCGESVPDLAPGIHEKRVGMVLFPALVRAEAQRQDHPSPGIDRVDDPQFFGEFREIVFPLAPPQTGHALPVERRRFAEHGEKVTEIDPRIPEIGVARPAG
ncbi:MAG: hypothetical protein IJU70_08550, partial [Lentisphaeria bacterium]|nr:hypothetical protein [Lentisphaeria bacterium]